MLGDTITVTLDGAGGMPVTLNKINQDAFTSEYLKKGPVYDLSMSIRHSKDNVKAGSQPFDRHTVTLTQTFHPTSALPNGRTYVAQLVLRNDPSGEEAVEVDLGEALVHWATDITLGKLYGWES